MIVLVAVVSILSVTEATLEKLSRTGHREICWCWIVEPLLPARRSGSILDLESSGDQFELPDAW